jgi:hypothetical protein
LSLLISFKLWPGMLSISSCIYWPFVHLLRIVSKVHWVHSLNGLLILCGVSFWSSLYILVINLLSDVAGKDFSPSVICLFSLLKLFSFIWFSWICQSFVLIAELLEFHSWSYYLCIYVPVYYLFFLFFTPFQLSYISFMCSLIILII